MKKTCIVKAMKTGVFNCTLEYEGSIMAIDVCLAKETGDILGKGVKTETMFAANYAACFDSALNMVIQTEFVQAGITAVTSDVSIGKVDKAGVTLKVEITGVNKAKAKELVNKAKQALTNITNSNYFC